MIVRDLDGDKLPELLIAPAGGGTVSQYAPRVFGVEAGADLFGALYLAVKPSINPVLPGRVGNVCMG
jgi:hypothetical protein